MNKKIESIDITIKNLIIDYMGEYDKTEHPFLLFDLAHVNENDHTRVLMGILKYNNFQFLPSFLQMIGAPEYKTQQNTPPQLTDQKKAIGNKGNGFIDLYIEYDSTNDFREQVIIENKINEAGDTEYQLSRYIATVLNPEMNPKDCKNICEEWENNYNNNDNYQEKFEHIHVIYLTSDGLKKPDIKSLPNFFRKETDTKENFEGNHINYYPINYLENIIPWLVNDVLPKMPYSDDGIAIAGIRQYIASLNAMFNGIGNSNIVETFVKELDGNDLEKYNLIIKTIMGTIKSLTSLTEGENNTETDDAKRIKNGLKTKGWDVKNLNLQPLLRDLRTAATEIFANDASDLGGDWKLYFTPSYIFLYKQKWADLDKRKYSIPSIYFVTSPEQNFFKGDMKWNLQVDHLDNKKESPTEIKPFTLSNRNKTASCKVLSEELKNQYNINDSSCRKKYYIDLIEKLNDYIGIVDKVVEKVRKESPSPFQEYMLQELALKLSNKQEPTSY